MKIKVDENLPPEAAPLLRQAGYDALSVRDQGLQGTDDQKLAEVCRNEERILLTLDVGFSDIRSYPPSISAGIVVLRLVRQSRKHVLAVLVRILPLLKSEQLTGRLWVVDEMNLRVYGETQT